MPTSLTADQALDHLLEGNRRFCAEQGTVPLELLSHFDLTLAAGQNPIAGVLACADSRVGPDHIFRTRPGELFTIRNAGHVATGGTIGSLEFAVEALGVPLVLLLRHTLCGAVRAAASGELPEAASLRELVQTVIDNGTGHGETDPEEIGQAHLEATLAQVRELSPVLTAAERDGRIRIRTGCYDLTTGAVRIDPYEVPAG